MTNMRVKWAFLVVVLLTAAYYLLPTLRYYSIPKEDRDPNDPRVSSIHKNAMKLGLDLQGGSYLVYEVDVEKIPEAERTGDEIDQVIEVIRNRVDQYGVLEPVIQKQGGNRIVVQLPGLQDPARAKELVGKTARLDFLLVQNAQELFQAMTKVDQVIARRGSEFLKGGLDTTTVTPTTPISADPLTEVLDGVLDGTSPGDTAAADTSVSDTTASAVDSLLDGANPFSGLFQQVDPNAGIVYCPFENYGLARRMLDEVAGDPADGTPAVLAGGRFSSGANGSSAARPRIPGAFSTR